MVINGLVATMKLILYFFSTNGSNVPNSEADIIVRNRDAITAAVMILDFVGSSSTGKKRVHEKKKHTYHKSIDEGNAKFLEKVLTNALKAQISINKTLHNDCT